MKVNTILLLVTLAGCLTQPQVKQGSTSNSSSTACPTNTQAEALNDPQSIDEVMALIIALPKPLYIHCFLQALKRPLYINATSSVTSVQRADGVNNPRIFIFKGDLIISLVPSGVGAAHLEFSEITGANVSIKGELSFPVYSTVALKTPYEEILNNAGNGTACMSCHGTETQYSTVDGVPVFQSKAFKPVPSQNVTLTHLRNQLYYCDFYKDSAGRCLIYRGLLSYGTVNAQAFPASMPTFFDPL